VRRVRRLGSHRPRLKSPGFLRLSGHECDGCVRTANPDSRPVASEISRGAPRISIRQGRTQPELTRTPNVCRVGHQKIEESATRYMILLQRIAALPAIYLEKSELALPEQKQPAPVAGGAVGHTLFELEQRLHLVVDTCQGFYLYSISKMRRCPMTAAGSETRMPPAGADIPFGSFRSA
jgi:hypothetical protein